MGKPKFHQSVLLFYGILFTDAETLEKAEAELTKRHGAIISKSRVYDFNYTGYYRKEMGGADIKRVFYAFEKLIMPDELADVKTASNALELTFSKDGVNRSINLDPGYLTLAKVVLASAKDNIQRIYIKDGIYAEITLYYKNHSFTPFEWTFPDYRESYISYFNELRNTYRDLMKTASETKRTNIK